MKKSGHFLVIIIISFILVTATTLADNDDGLDTGESAAHSQEQQLTDGVVNSQPTDIVTTTNIAPSTASGDFEIPAGSSVSVNNKGDLTSSALTSAQTKSGLKLTSAFDATISKNGDVAFLSADKVIINDITITNPKNFQYNHNSKLIQFSEAAKVSSSNYLLENLKQSFLEPAKIQTTTEHKQIFQNKLGTIELSPKKDSQIILDFSKEKTTIFNLKKTNLVIKTIQNKPLLSAESDAQIIEITETDKGYITRAENSIITVSTNQIDERFVGNETLFEWNIDDGVTKALLQSPGAYRYTFKELQQDRNGIYARADKTFAQSYEIQRTENLPKYTLFIDKSLINNPSLNPNEAHLSLPTHKLTLNGIINYNRINFDLKTTQRFMGGTYWMEVLPADGSFLPILETNAEGTTIIMLDNNNVRANISTTSNKYTAYFDDIAIKKDNELTRVWATSPFIINTLTVSPTLSFKNIPNDSWTVTQYNNELPVAEFHSKQDDRKKLLEKTMNNYKDTQCDTLNNKLSISYDAIKQLIEAFA